MIARYDHADGGMDATPDGDYVDFEDLVLALMAQDKRIAELEAAIDKLAQCKGRFHTEANFKALIEVRNKSLHK